MLKVARAPVRQRLRRRSNGANQCTSTTRASSTSGIAENGAQHIEDIELYEEASRSYLAYAMSVIVGRALPDVRDGLKPVHRRTLFAMRDLGLSSSKPFRKSARVVGEVLGKLHPHGDSAVYASLVRMAQPFSMREPLIDGHGNFGSLDDDPPAAMRYTECRLRPISESLLLEGLSLGAVPWMDNFDGSMKEPEVLPAKLPHLLLNGASGIAVGMATNVPSHSLSEVCDAICMLAKSPDASTDELMQALPGPDFATGGVVLHKSEVREAYRSGRGRIALRGRTQWEEHKGMRSLVVTEVAYQTNKAELVKKIAEMSREEAGEGISEVRDESDREGIRVVVDVKRNSDSDKTFHQLCQRTKLETSITCNMVALNGQRPQLMPVIDQIKEFISFRRQVIRNKARERLEETHRRRHIIEGLLAVLEDLDRGVHIIRSSKDTNNAQAALMQFFQITRHQATEALNMPLRRLTTLERGKLDEERDSLAEEMKGLQKLMDSDEAVLEAITKESTDLKQRFGTERRTRILDAKESIEDSNATKAAAMGPQRTGEASLIAVTEQAYARRIPADSVCSRKHRGSKGSLAGKLKAGDALRNVVLCNDDENVIALTERGDAFSFDSLEFPPKPSGSLGVPLNRLNPNLDSEKVACLLRQAARGGKPSDGKARESHREEEEEEMVVILTSKGGIKRIGMDDIGGVNRRRKRALLLKKDEVVQSATTSNKQQKGKQYILLCSKKGRVSKFEEAKVRRASRNAGSMKAMRQKGEEDAACCIAAAGEEHKELLILTNKGRAVRVDVSSVPEKGRVAGGVKVVRMDRAEEVVASMVPLQKEEGHIILSTRNALMQRTEIRNVRKVRRGSKGVKILRLSDCDSLLSLHLSP